MQNIFAWIHPEKMKMTIVSLKNTIGFDSFCALETEKSICMMGK